MIHPLSTFNFIHVDCGQLIPFSDAPFLLHWLADTLLEIQ